MAFWRSMASLRVRLATGAASYSGRYATRGAVSLAFGAQGLAVEIVSSQRFTEADGQESTQRTQIVSECIVTES